MKKILITIFLTIFIITSALADEWNWKQFSDYVYLNTDKIEYYTDEAGYNHAVVCQKHFRKKGDKDDDRVDAICMKHYKKHLGYQYVINDININKKTATLSYIIFFDPKGNELGAVEMGKKEDCQPIPPLTVEDDIFQYVVNIRGSKVTGE